MRVILAGQAVIAGQSRSVEVGVVAALCCCILVGPGVVRPGDCRSGHVFAIACVTSASTAD